MDKHDYKQLLDEVFVISGKVEESVISREPKAEADNTKQQPNLIIFLLYIVLKKITRNTLSRFHIKKISTLGLIPFCRVAPGYFSF